MKKYTVLSYCFGGYDLCREPLKADPAAEYIFVTDKQINSVHWRIIVEPKLATMNPIYASYYVRWHPFKYANTDTVIVMDASIKIKDSLGDIYNAFKESGSEYAPLCTVFKNDIDKINFWVNTTKRLDISEAERLFALNRKLQKTVSRGSLGMTMGIFRRTTNTERYMKHVWRYLMALGHDGVPQRLDEVVAHNVLYFYKDVLDIFPLSVQIIQSSYMTYCEHNSDVPIKKYNDYDQYFYICDCPVSPVRFDKSINFPRSYKFKAEAILLTKYSNESDLIEWLNHHLNTVKFEHIHVFDNESDYNVKDVCNRYGERVSYQKVYGQARQYCLYNAYVNWLSSAEWVMPIDDDEYLDIGNFDSVYDAIQYYNSKLPHMMILGVRWKHLFPKKFHTERKGKVLDYCTEENPALAKTFMHLGDTTVKCIVKRYGNIHYEETWETPGSGHVPKHSCFYGAVMCDGRAAFKCGIPNCPDHLEDERIRLIHCRYKGYSEWMAKYGNADKEKNCRTVCDSYQRDKKFMFNDMLDSIP